MGRVKIDNRIRTLIENGVVTGHRSMFAIVGRKARDQIVTLHQILTKSVVGAKPNVLWCYKKELSHSTSKKKRIKEKKIKEKASVITPDESDAFEMFVSSTNIRYCYYAESHNILGNTYGMLVLQDFEAVTPNLLARAIETVEGGGLVIFLLDNVNSLRQLFTMTMDVHSRYRTESHTEIVPRFNERFILSLSSCKTCMVVDDQLNILPISSNMLKIEPLPNKLKSITTKEEQELLDLQQAMADSKPIGQLLKLCKTSDQGKVLLRLLDVITEKSLRATCSITAARGRGKSASLGLAVAGGIGFGYSNIFVTSPSPENLKTLFEFIVKGFDAMDYQEHADYELVQSTNPEFKNALVRINIFREHRQTIQYIHPTDASKLGQAELVVIDEAAAIPLPLVKELISGQYLVFLSSTINGYEGTGRSLSLKLLQQLRNQTASLVTKDSNTNTSTSLKRTLFELTLDESIRYKPGDDVEDWLNRILCLDATKIYKMVSGTPPPKECELYYVNRDTLFSFHKASEQFLMNLMSIYVSAHYKNTPNDLQLLSDAPNHHVFVLLGPVTDEQKKVPDVLAVVQVCLEGNLSKSSVKSTFESGRRGAGDLLPWTISQQFLENNFATLSGARVIRIAVHPDFQSMGYGSRALELVEQYYRGEFPCLKENNDKNKSTNIKSVKDHETLSLLEEQIAPRENLPPLLIRLEERKAEQLDYLGVSFGLTLNLLKFWKKAGFAPVYVRQTTNDLTGEHTTIMLKALGDEDDEQVNWMADFFTEFRQRLTNLLSYQFKVFSPHLALSLMFLRHNPALKKMLEKVKRNVWTQKQLAGVFSNRDLRRLSQYSKNMIDHHLITDLVPTLATLYFTERFDEKLTLNLVQSAILLGVGLQRKTVDEVAESLDMPVRQVLALYMKAIKAFSEHLDDIFLDAMEEEVVKARNVRTIGDIAIGDDDTSQMRSLEEHMKKPQKSLVQKDNNDVIKQFKEYEIKGSEEDWKNAVDKLSIKDPKTVSVVSKRRSNVDPQAIKRSLIDVGVEEKKVYKKKKLNKFIHK